MKLYLLLIGALVALVEANAPIQIVHELARPALPPLPPLEILGKNRNARVYMDEESQLRCLDAINEKRYLHESTPLLMLGRNLTQYTVDRAHAILRDIENKREITKGSKPYGESFYWYYDPKYFKDQEDAVSTWYDESKYYDYHNPGFSSKTGGFSQMVWKGSRLATCIKIEYESSTHFKTLVVANYYPAGNVEGEFPYNVLPPKGSSSDDLSQDYPYDEPPYRPRPPSKPSRPDYERPQRPPRPDSRPPLRPGDRPSRPDYDRPVRPDTRPPRPSRPDYEPDYEKPTRRPVRPGRPDYPTHPISYSLGNIYIEQPIDDTVPLLLV